MISTQDFYIDLGTANTLIYAKKKGFLLNEPSVLAIRHKSKNRNEVYALGTPAKLMLGKTPENLSILRPLREGVIADFDHAARMLHTYIKRVRQNILWLRPRMLISLPCQVSEFERRAVEEIGFELGARQVHLLDEPVAAAIGAGLEILNNRGHMVVDIGGGTTEIAVISLGGIVTSQAVRIGGDTLDDAIMEHIRSKFNFIIGEQTAELIKKQIASAMPLLTNTGSMQIGGLNLFKALPSKLTIDAQMIFPAVDSVIRDFVQAIRKTLELCPPEIVGDILQEGIILTGGGALLHGLRERIAQDVGVPVFVAPHPLMSVAMGGAKTLENNQLLERLEHN